MFSPFISLTLGLSFFAEKLLWVRHTWSWVHSCFALLEVEKLSPSVWNDHRNVSAVMNYKSQAWTKKTELEHICQYTGTEKKLLKDIFMNIWQ